MNNLNKGMLLFCVTGSIVFTGCISRTATWEVPKTANKPVSVAEKVDALRRSRTEAGQARGVSVLTEDQKREIEAATAEYKQRLEEYNRILADWDAFIAENSAKAHGNLEKARSIQQRDKNDMFFLGNASNLTGGVLLTASAANGAAAGAFVAAGTLFQAQIKAQDEGAGGLDELKMKKGALTQSFVQAAAALNALAAAAESGKDWGAAKAVFQSARTQYELAVTDAIPTPVPDKKGIIRRTWEYWVGGN